MPPVQLVIVQLIGKLFLVTIGRLGRVFFLVRRAFTIRRFFLVRGWKFLVHFCLVMVTKACRQ